MKKLIALAVCLLITVSALVGCVARGDTAQISGSSALSSSLMDVSEIDKNNSLSAVYTEKKYEQYYDMIVEFFKKPEIVELCSIPYTGPIIYLQDYNLDNVPEVVIRYWDGDNSKPNCRQLICDLKTGKIMGVLYNTANCVYIGQNEDGSEYVFVKESPEYEPHYYYDVWSRLLLTRENTFVRDRYLYACNSYRDEDYNPVEVYYKDIPLEIGNSYKPYFLTGEYIPIDLMPQECETTEQSCFTDCEVKREEAVRVGVFYILNVSDFNIENKVFFAAEGEFVTIGSKIKLIYSNLDLSDREIYSMEDFFAEDFWDEYTYLYEG